MVESLGRVRAAMQRAACSVQRAPRLEERTLLEVGGSRVRWLFRRYRCIYASDYASVSQRSPLSSFSPSVLPDPLSLPPPVPPLSPPVHHLHQAASRRFVQCLRERTAVSLFDVNVALRYRGLPALPARGTCLTLERTASGSLVERREIQRVRDLYRGISRWSRSFAELDQIATEILATWYPCN